MPASFCGTWLDKLFFSTLHLALQSLHLREFASSSVPFWLLRLVSCLQWRPFHYNSQYSDRIIPDHCCNPFSCKCFLLSLLVFNLLVPFLVIFGLYMAFSFFYSVLVSFSSSLLFMTAVSRVYVNVLYIFILFSLIRVLCKIIFYHHNLYSWTKKSLPSILTANSIKFSVCTVSFVSFHYIIGSFSVWPTIVPQ